MQIKIEGADLMRAALEKSRKRIAAAIDEAILESAGMIRRSCGDPRPGYDLDLTATEIRPDQKLLPAPKGGDDVEG